MNLDSLRGVLSIPYSGAASRQGHPLVGPLGCSATVGKCVRAIAATLAALAVAGTADAQEACSQNPERGTGAARF